MRHADYWREWCGLLHGIRRDKWRVQLRELVRVFVLRLFRHHFVTVMLRIVPISWMLRVFPCVEQRRVGMKKAQLGHIEQIGFTIT